MGIMDIFSGFGGGNTNQPTTPPASTAPAPNSGAGNPGNIPPNTGTPPTGDNVTAPNGVVPPTTTTNPPTTTTNEENKTPLDEFADIWKNEPTDPNKAKPTGVFGNVDPKKFAEAAGRIDFSKVVSPEQLASIAKGGEDAQKAFATALNSVAQTVYAQSAFASTKMIDAALARAKEGFMADLPQHIKKQQVGESLRNENDIFSNPAVSPIIGALESQLTIKYPNASAREITDMAKRYVSAFGAAVAPAPETNSTKNSKRTEQDWDEFFKT